MRGIIHRTTKLTDPRRAERLSGKEAMEQPIEQRADERGADSVQRPCSAIWTPPNKKYPTVHSIRNATGARAAVLLKHPTAKPRRTDDVGTLFGRTCPIYAIVANKMELGRGNGTTDAWEQTAIALYSPNRQ